MRRAKDKHIRDSIMAFLKAAGLRDIFEENLAIAFWDGVVGPEVAKKTEPHKVTKGTLFVKVRDTVWRNELTFLKPQIIQKLNDKLEEPAIKDIKFY